MRVSGGAGWILRRLHTSRYRYGIGRIGDERLRGLRHRRLAEPPSHYSIVPFTPQQPGVEGHLAWLHVILAGDGKSGNRRVFERIMHGDSHACSGWAVHTSRMLLPVSLRIGHRESRQHRIAVGAQLRGGSGLVHSRRTSRTTRIRMKRAIASATKSITTK